MLATNEENTDRTNKGVNYRWKDVSQTQQQRPEWLTVSGPGMRVNTRDVNSTRRTSLK